MSRKLEDIRKLADKVITLSMKEAQTLPGMLGISIPFSFREIGYATAVVGKEKVFYEYREESNVK